MKYPEQPKSPKQKYLLTEKGKVLLKQRKNKGSGDLFYCLCHFYFCIKCFKFSNTDMCLYSLSCEMEYGSGFKVSLSMLKKMRIFYEEWQCLSIGSPLVNQLQQLENKTEEGVEIGEKSAERLFLEDSHQAQQSC